MPLDFASRVGRRRARGRSRVPEAGASAAAVAAAKPTVGVRVEPAGGDGLVAVPGDVAARSRRAAADRVGELALEGQRDRRLPTRRTSRSRRRRASRRGGGQRSGSSPQKGGLGEVEDEDRFEGADREAAGGETILQVGQDVMHSTFFHSNDLPIRVMGATSTSIAASALGSRERVRTDEMPRGINRCGRG